MAERPPDPAVAPREPLGEGEPLGDAGSVEPLGSAGRNGDFVRSFERGLAVIRAFGRDTPRLTLSDVARSTGLTRAAARRFLLTLAELGYVHSDGRYFSLRPRVLDLGHAYLSTLGLEEVAAPHMEQLVADVRESSSVAVLDGDDIVYVVRVPTKRIMTVAIAVGTRFPAYATSMGRVLLAGLPPADLEAYLARADLTALTGHTVTGSEHLRSVVADAAALGYAVVDQELEEGLRSVAVGILDASGRVMGAINVSVHASRASLDDLRHEILPKLQASAARINDDLRTVGRAPLHAVT